MNKWTLSPLVALCATSLAHAAPPLSAQVSTDRTQYPAGRVVEINLALRNEADFPQTIQMQGVFEYDVLVRNRAGDVVWQWSANKRPSRQLTRFDVPANSSRKTREIWDRRDLQGQKVADGVYSIEARLFPMKPVVTQIYLGSGADTVPARDREAGNRGGSGRDRGGERGGDRGGNIQDGPIGTPFERGFFAQLKPNRKSVRVGETLDFTYTVSNQTDYLVEYSFNDGQINELEAILNGRCVWRLSESRPSPDRRFTQFQLLPDTRKQFNVSIPIVKGTRPGQYTFRAYLRANNYQVGTAGEAFVKVNIDE